MTEIERLREALEKIAAFDNRCANYRLTLFGSYGGFKEPNSVRIARAALAATPSGAERGEWKLVPVEPTREMWAASGDAVINIQHRDIGHHDQFSEAVWRAMLKAAPPSPPASEGEK